MEMFKEQKGFQLLGLFDFVIGFYCFGKQVIEVENVMIVYDGCMFVDCFNELVILGEWIGIIGLNGIGKIMLLNIFVGCYILDGGYIIIGQMVRIGYYIQDYSEMNGELKVIEYIKEMVEVVKIVDGDIIIVE